MIVLATVMVCLYTRLLNGFDKRVLSLLQWRVYKDHYLVDKSVLKVLSASFSNCPQDVSTG